MTDNEEKEKWSDIKNKEDPDFKKNQSEASDPRVQPITIKTKEKWYFGQF